MDKYLLVAVGGATGAMARYALGGQTLRWFGSGWPYGTFAANLIGGLAMGLLAGVLALKGGADQERWGLLLVVGVLGGFTTFSAFSLDFATLWARGAMGGAAAYLLVSVIGSLAAVFAALAVAKGVWG